MLSAVERVLIGTNQRQIALSVLESLRDDLMYAHLNNGGRVLDVADLRQYIYEQMGRIRTNALVLDGPTTMATGKTSVKIMVTGKRIPRENWLVVHRITLRAASAFVYKPFHPAQQNVS